MEFIPRKKVQGRALARRESNFSWQILRGLLRLFLLALLVLLVWYVTRLPAFTIREVAVAGGETISHEEVRAKVEAELAGTYFLVVPKRFSYLYPKDHIAEVVGQVPRIHDVHVVRSSRHLLSVSFEEYVPYALWCAGDGEQCWFIDSAGYAFAPSPSLHGGALVRHLDEGAKDVGEGEVISPEKLARIDAFVERANDELSFRITSLTHRENGDIELFINGGGSILLASGRDFGETFENLKTVLHSPEFEHLKPGNFRYVDARFTNKVFVNEELEPELATTTATTSLSE